MSTSTDEFFEQNYPDLLTYCRQRWNGSGEDVLHETYLIIRGRYQTVTFSLFVVTTREAARNLGLFKKELPLHENIPYSEQPYKSKDDPRLERLREVLAHHGHHGNEEEILSQDMIRKIRAEYYGQLSFAFTEEGH